MECRALWGRRELGLVFPKFAGRDWGPPQPLNEVGMLGHGRFTEKETEAWRSSAASPGACPWKG